MPAAVKVFTKDNPCTKRDLWECFVGPTGFRTVLVVEAHSVIGVNAPRGMEKMGRLAVKRTPRGEYYTLTAEGREWLKKGVLSYAKNHPVDAAGIPYMEYADAPATAPVRRRRLR